MPYHLSKVQLCEWGTTSLQYIFICKGNSLLLAVSAFMVSIANKDHIVYVYLSNL